MRPHDAEKLLGGYAAGILTEEEKTRLFSAALEHQELFDALAEEEALRELLADPKAREHLLGLLSQPAVRNPRPLWRRPSMLGIAASFLAVVTTSVVLLHRIDPVSPSSVGEKQKAEPATSPAAPLESEAITKPLARRSPEFKAAQAPKDLPAADASLAGISAQRPAPAPTAAQERKKEARAQDSAAVAEVVASPSPIEPSKMETTANLSKESLARLPKSTSSAERATLLAPGVVAGSAAPIRVAAGKGPASHSDPTWTLNNRETGQPTLIVTHATGRFLYVLKRSGAGAVTLAPRQSVPLPDGLIQTTFQFPADGADHVDLYLLDHREPNPNGLPEKGPMEGFRKRIF